MTTKPARVAELLDRDVAGHLRRIHDCLIALGLTTRMPPNSQTLLFEVRDGGKMHGLAAMRSGYVNVLSFPKTYWASRLSALERGLSSIGARHFIETQGAISESQYSIRQVRVSNETAGELELVVNNLIAEHITALRE